MHFVEFADTSVLNEVEDRIFKVDDNLYRMKSITKFPADGAFQHSLRKERGLVAIHPISGVIADYVYSTDEVNFIDCKGMFIKRTKLPHAMVAFQWMNRGEEMLICYFSNCIVQVINFYTLESTTYNLSSVLRKNSLESIVISSACFNNCSHLYCILSNGELFEFFAWKADGSFQILIYETGIKFCVEICAVSNTTMYGYNKSYLYRIELCNPKTVCTKLTDSFRFVSPIFPSFVNPDVLAFIVADEKDSKACHLKVYNSAEETLECSLKLTYMPEGIFFFANDSYIISAAKSFTVVNRSQHKFVECYENIQLFQLLQNQCIILSQSGIELVSFTSKLLERMKDSIKNSIPFNAGDFTPSVQIVETIFQIASNEWNSEQQRVLVQVAQQVSYLLCESEYDKHKIAKCIKFLNFINKLRQFHSIACFSVPQSNVDNLIGVLLKRELIDACLELFAIFTFSESIAELVFSSWLSRQPENASCDCTKIIDMQRYLHLSPIQMIKTISESGRKDILLKILPFVKDIDPLVNCIGKYSVDEIVKIMRNFSNESNIPQCFDLVEKLIKEFHLSAKPKLFSIFSKNKDISRFFEDYCLNQTDLWPLLKKFYYAMDNAKLEKRISHLISSSMSISTPKDALVKYTVQH